MEAAATKASGVAAQQLSLPKGGGAVSGLDAEITASAFSGTFSVSINLPLTPARDLVPTLTLSYDSSNGNGIFGAGFALSVPSIARKTTKRIPRYDESDDFVSSSAGDLTRAAAPIHDVEDDEWTITTYVPRNAPAQGAPLFEYRVSRRTGVSYWIEYRGDDTTHVYGESALARVANPEDGTQIFEWMIEEDRDAKGNRIRYTYDQDAAGPPQAMYDVNRSWTAQRYVSRIEYGNYNVSVDPPVEAFAFAVVLDYGETPHRADPFSSYRSGFEIRTTRLCRALLLYHHFAELGPDPCLVRETRFTYDESKTLSRLTSVQEIGYRRQVDGSIWRSEKPSVDLTFSNFVVPRFPIFEPLTIEGGGTLPDLPNAGAYQFIDLKGEGLPGVLLSNADTTVYYEPEGDARYTSPQAVPSFPNARDVTSGQVQLTDLNADGVLDLVDVRGGAGAAGYFEQRSDGSWAPFQAFASAPTALAELEPVDLDGSGRTSLLLVGASNVTCYQSAGTSGYASPQSEPKAEGFPAALNLSAQEVVLFADVFGDGGSHRVRVRDGQVQAWPNLGFGRFGPPVTFGHSPRFAPDISSARIYLADLDGSGPADLVVGYADRLEIHLNHSGNTFSDPIVVQLPDLLGDGAQLTFADIRGSGTTSIVFSTLLPTPRHWACDLAAPGAIHAHKPYLLTRIDHGLGVLTTVTYASSVKFYLEDKAAGRPWVTRLPFPVQVVERIDHHDEVSRTLMVSRYRYHDGYYDAAEKQFAGFGYVESWDTERPREFLRSAAGHGLAAADVAPEPAMVMPTYVRTWFYTGSFEQEPAQTAQYRREYFHGDPEADADFPGPVFDERILRGDAELLRQAWWTLKGGQRRQETYGDDDAPDASTPYLVSEQNYLVTLVQPAVVRYASLRQTGRETLTYTYERDAHDPRIEHTFVLALDEYGNPRLTAAVAYPRREAPGRDVLPEQAELGVTLQQNAYVNRPDPPPQRLIGVAYEQRELNTHGIALEGGARYFTFDALAAQVAAALPNEIPYGAPFTPDARQVRAYSWTQAYYWSTGLTHMLSLGEVGQPALAHHTRQAAFTDEWLTRYGNRVTTPLLEEQAGFIQPADSVYWWSREPITYYLGGAGQFYQRYRSAFDYDEAAYVDGLKVDQRVTFAAPYYLVPIEQRMSVNATVEQVTTASLDYQAMKPWQLVDSNGIYHQVLYDPLGIVFAASIFKFVDGVRIGDGDLTDYVVRSDATFTSVIDNPAFYLEEATTFFFYDLLAWRREGTPACFIELQRQQHVSDILPNTTTPIKTLIGYFDGFSRIVEKKLKADLAEVPAGNAVLTGPPDDDPAERWIVSDRTIYNNKAKPAEKYPPYFSDTPAFDPVLAATRAGIVPPPERSFYDALTRVIRTETPKGFLRRTEYAAWTQTDYDEDDTVLDAPYYQWFMAHYPPDPTQAQKDEKAALDKAAVFFNTPTVEVFDNRRFRIRVIANNLGTLLTTFEAVDVRGQKTVLIDPRLYQENLKTGADVANFRFAYPMHDDKDQAWQTISTDAGERWTIKNVHGTAVALWDARGLAFAVTVDRLQRMLATDVTGADAVTFRAQQVTYGDGLPDAAAHNLWGQVSEYRDDAGLIVNQDFNLDAQLAETRRRFRVDYRGQVNWLAPVALQDKAYRTAATYTVQNTVLTRTTDDASTYGAGYYVSGRLRDVRETWADGSLTRLIDAFTYTPAGKPIGIDYGNQVTARRRYEPTTGRLVEIFSDSAPGAVFQHITYTYDPVGNVTLMRDLSAETVFCYNQEVEAKGDYTYDSLYRLIRATGRQHPGIDATTHINGFKQSIFAELCPPNPNDQVKLEQYIETYAYDDSDNLVRRAHDALSASFVVETSVDPFSNHLAGAPYDADGNGLELSLNNAVTLTWDYANRLVQTTLIEREDGANDQVFCNYDYSGQRIRKVTERVTQGGTVTEVEDWLYVETYQQRVTHKLTAAADEAWVSAERLRLPAGSDMAATVDTWFDQPARHDANRRGAVAGREIRLQLSNLQGSISVEIDYAAATVVSYEEYYPFGGTAVIAGPSKAAVVPKVFRYANQECDDATGLYYYGARYFVPWQSRWLTADPAGDIDGPNLYAFVGNNPLTRRDQGGLVWRTVTEWRQASYANSQSYRNLVGAIRGGFPAVQGQYLNLGGRDHGQYSPTAHRIDVDQSHWRYYGGQWQIDDEGWSVAIFEATNAFHRDVFTQLDLSAKTSGGTAGERQSYAQQVEGVEFVGTTYHHQILSELTAARPALFPARTQIYSNGPQPLWTDHTTYLQDQELSGHTQHYRTGFNTLHAQGLTLAEQQQRDLDFGRQRQVRGYNRQIEQVWDRRIEARRQWREFTQSLSQTFVLAVLILVVLWALGRVFS